MKIPAKTTKTLIHLLLISILCFSFLPVLMLKKAVAGTESIIADHRAVAYFDSIPPYYIEAVKHMFLSLPGQSHSAAYRRGLELVEELDPNTYSLINYDDIEPDPNNGEALQISRWVKDSNNLIGEAQWYTWHAWDPMDQNFPTNNAQLIANHIEYCENNNIHISAIGFGWCWDMTMQDLPGGGIDTIEDIEFHWAGASDGGPNGNHRWGLDDGDYEITQNHVNMNDYLIATSEYLGFATSYNTTVFFTTGPVDENSGTENGFQREIKNQYIRDHFSDIYSQAFLFDYADILTHNDSGELFQSSWDGHLFPQIHPDNLEGASVGHIGEVGALRLGKALWWMLARIAGWDGNPVSELPGDANYDGLIDDEDILTVEDIILDRIFVSEFPHNGDSNSDNIINVVDITDIERKIHDS